MPLINHDNKHIYKMLRRTNCAAYYSSGGSNSHKSPISQCKTVQMRASPSISSRAILLLQ